MMVASWSTFLPGRFHITRGERADYLGLERFHYRRGRPATWAEVWVVRYGDDSALDRVVAVGVLSFPCVNCDARDRALGIGCMPAKEKLRFVNRHVRVISRIVVHPQFRAMGLASRLIRAICAQGNVRWIEAMAAMGRVHPLFERGGMKCLGQGRRGVKYYLSSVAERRQKVAQGASPAVSQAIYEISLGEAAEKCSRIAPLVLPPLRGFCGIREGRFGGCCESRGLRPGLLFVAAPRLLNEEAL